MKKLLTLLLITGLGLKASSGELYNPTTFEVVPTTLTWSESFFKTVDALTLGQARRAAVAAIVSGYSTVTSTAKAAATNATYAHENFVVPTWRNTCAATRETWSASKDFVGLMKNTGYAVGKFMHSHPQVTLAAVVGVSLYYGARAWSGSVEKQFNRLQKVIKNAITGIDQFDTSSADSILAERRTLLEACELYYIVTYNLDAGYWYKNEANAIDDFLEQVRILKVYIATMDVRIQSQVKAVQDAAKLVQYILSKRLNLNAVQTALKI